MKRVFALLLACLLVFSLTACGGAASQEEIVTPTPEVTATPEADPMEQQLTLLFNSVCLLKTNTSFEDYWYTISDFDHNGRLEVTGAITEGTGSFTSALMYEVAEDMQTLQEVDLGLAEGEFLPEIIKSQVEVYHDTANDTYNYVYFDSTKVDAGNHCQALELLCLQDGKLTITPLGYLSITTDPETGNTVNSFTDASGATLENETEYLALAANHFAGITAETQYVDWFSLDEIHSMDRLVQSYSVFTGDTELEIESPITPVPEYTLAPEPTATATPEVVANPVVTKNPTSESVYVGGSCQFVARADNAESMRWKLMDAAGNVYDVMSSPFPQLGVSGPNSTCLTLSNLPLAMSGYRVFAEFYGSTTVQSGSCYVYVNEAPTATVSASQNSGYTFGNLYNSICLYSSNGGNIHYECIKSGDSGPYASSEIGNGGEVPIVGIEGQCITVEVYCNVVGSEKVCYYTYKVDLTPSYEPTEYSEEGTVTGDNYTEVFVQTSSGTYYIEKSACMFAGTGYPSVGDSATVTFRDGEVLIAVLYCTGSEI